MPENEKELQRQRLIHRTAADIERLLQPAGFEPHDERYQKLREAMLHWAVHAMAAFEDYRKLDPQISRIDQYADLVRRYFMANKQKDRQ